MAFGTDNTAVLQRIFNNEDISEHFEQNFPHVSELLQENFKGTAAMLCMRGSTTGQKPLQLFKIGQNMRYEQHGTDNLKTWIDYRQGVHNFLKSLNDDRRLEQARTVLADHIHEVHYKRFPNWPAIGEQQQSEIYINISSSYPFESWFIGWSCVGYITVQDYRADAVSYYTDFEGEPEFKIVYCNNHKLQEIEELAEGDMNAARLAIMTNQISRLALEFENFTSRFS